MRLQDLLLPSGEYKPRHYSEGLRLRANYLIYTLVGALTTEQRVYLESAEIPWAEYEQVSPLGAVVNFLRSVSAGIYLPHLTPALNETQSLVCVFLLDPHLIDDFEHKISKNRQGVLIRRPILGSLHFQETIPL